MNYLIIDTSAAHLSVIVKNSQNKKVYFNPNCKENHSAHLMHAVENTLKEANATLEGLNYLGVVVGPGSFTGIRIGISTIKALALANNLPIVCVTAFDVLAYNIQNENVVCLIDAAHDNFYVCKYQNKKPISTPQFLSKSQVLQNYANHTFASFEQIDGIDSHICDRVLGFTSAVENNLNFAVAPNLVRALYVKKSQAEEQR